MLRYFITPPSPSSSPLPPSSPSPSPSLLLLFPLSLYFSVGTWRDVTWPDKWTAVTAVSIDDTS